tara:strand:+ start:487 stop:774 length:288 start_codon:yes stop_codon:yes gene_type:complete
MPDAFEILKVQRLLMSQQYNTEEMFWTLLAEFPGISRQEIVKLMSERPSIIEGQESIQEFMDSLGAPIVKEYRRPHRHRDIRVKGYRRPTRGTDI